MKTLLVITGPTAVGKTELSLSVAKLLSSFIISADSRQIYKGMKIGTAAPTEEELRQVKHFFVHTLELDQYYSAAIYEEQVLKLLDNRFQTTDYAVMTGGSMMYIDAVCNGIDDIPTIDDATRNLLHERLQTEGIDTLLAELRLLDPDYYAVADLKNTKRVVHALEVCYMTGHPFSSFHTGTRKQRPFRVVKIGLRRERQQLFDRINRRVDQMMADGLMEEARQLYPMRHLNALNTVGYKELFKVIGGEWELPFAVERMKKNTRVYAKKQMTWFKNDPGMNWIDLDGQSLQQIIEKIQNLLR